MSKVGKEIRAARLRRGMSQVDLAHLIGVTPTTISRWEQGHTEPRSRALWRRLEEVLGVKRRHG